MRLKHFSEEKFEKVLVSSNLLKILIQLIDKNSQDEIDRHLALNSYWILSQIAMSSDSDLLSSIFEVDQKTLLRAVNTDLNSNDFERVELVIWFLSNASSPVQTIFKLILDKTYVVEVFEKMTHLLKTDPKVIN